LILTKAQKHELVINTYPNKNKRNTFLWSKQLGLAGFGRWFCFFTGHGQLVLFNGKNAGAGVGNHYNTTPPWDDEAGSVGTKPVDLA